MPEANFRALCEELVEYVSLLDEPPHELVVRARALLDQPVVCNYPSCVENSEDERCSRWLTGECQGPDSGACAALAQPEPVAPTDEELTLVYDYAVAAAVGNKRGQFTPKDAEAAQLAGLRAVLARYGTPANNTREESFDA